jgi:hypothetical protein
LHGVSRRKTPIMKLNFILRQQAKQQWKLARIGMSATTACLNAVQPVSLAPFLNGVEQLRFQIYVHHDHLIILEHFNF